MLIYLDPDYRCYLEYGDGYREVETDAFDGKCKAFIEGYRYIPEGETWTRSDGEIFTGEMIAPYKPFELLEAAQQKYEETSEELAAALVENADMKDALNALEVKADG